MISAFAPGRVEILGNHTDYNGGLVLSAAIELGITCSGQTTGDNSIHLRSREVAGEIRFSPGEELLPNSTWADYPLGVVKILRDAGYPVGGFEAEFTSTLPTGAGLSSSAALEVSTAVFLSRLFGFSLEPMQLAKLCRLAENQFVGVNCGLLDQVSSVFGLRNHFVHLDCRRESVELLPVPAEIALLIVDSRVKHTLTGGEYNERREQCFLAAEKMGVSELRDASLEMLAAASLPPLIARRASHIIDENNRVREGSAALAAGDMQAFGELLFASHKSSRDNFENSTAELDALVEIASGISGVYGSRLTGGGFGGATISLVQQNKAKDVASQIVREYALRTGNGAVARVCLCADGAKLPQ